MGKMWTDFPLNKQLWQSIAEAGFESPTPIQEKAIPPILSGQHVIGIAQTGTGKTAAYLLPILMKAKYAQGQHPRVLILTPTKELAVQVAQQATQLAAHTDLRIGAIYGGSALMTQREKIKAGLDIVIATPGRFLEFYQAGILITKQLNTWVLDEADKMMHGGLLHQVRKIFDVIPVKKQSLLFSATFSEKIQQLADEFLLYPIKIEIERQATPAATIYQCAYRIPNRKTKINFIEHRLLTDESFSKVLIFVNTKTMADNLYRYIERKKIGTVKAYHGNKEQNTRLHALEKFKQDEVRVLISTDAASRGIDVSGISHVVNFDVPKNPEDYIHRIGRTGRAEQTGEALSLVTPAEIWHVQQIEKLIRKKIPFKNLPDEIELAPTDKTEAKEMAKEIDAQKRKDNPDFQGAFHDRKRK